MSTYPALPLALAAMTAIVGLRYLGVSGGFAWLTARRHPGLYASLGPQIKREICWSLASAAIYGVPAGLVAWGWQAARLDADLHRRFGLSALVAAAVGARLSRAPR